MRAVVHVHGASVRPEYDGHPERLDSSAARRPSTSTRTIRRGDALVPRPHDGHQSPERLCRPDGAYLIRDEEEDALHLPNGSHEIPLFICDRVLRRRHNFSIRADDPDRPWVPEVFGDAMLVNGTLIPYLTSSPRDTDFAWSTPRTAGSCASAFERHGGHAHRRRPGPARRGRVGAAHRTRPGRACGCHRRFPGPGRPRDYRGQRRDADHAGSRREYGRRTMRPDPSRTLRPIERLAATAAIRTRTHTLGEDRDMTQSPMRMLLNGMHWHMPVTEIAELGSTEIWNLVNTTDDSHPIHLHLVRFQILDRRSFDVFTYVNEQKLRYTAAAIPPDATEAGWKDTVRAHAGDGDAHHHQIRGLPRPLHVALPHPRARRQRNDAPAPDRSGDARPGSTRRNTCGRYTPGSARSTSGLSRSIAAKLADSARSTLCSARSAIRRLASTVFVPT